MIKMEEKDALVNSIMNLKNHVVLGQQQQIEIFKSLSTNDFSKIIDNMNDNNKSNK
jgi:hypothetical protein